MAMADQTPPNFEDLEPEGDNYTETEAIPELDDFEEEAFDEFFEEHLGDYESSLYEGFDNFEDLVMEGDRDTPRRMMSDDRHDPRYASRERPSLAMAAARIALKWGSYGDANKGNRQRPVSLLATPSTQQSAAALQEARELSEALSVMAATTSNPLAAMGLMAATVPIIVGQEPQVYRALWPAIPVLIRGIMGTTKFLHQRRATRPYIKLLAKIMQSTVKKLAQWTLEGPISQRTIAKVLAGETKTMLSQQLAPASKKRRIRRARPRYYGYQERAGRLPGNGRDDI